MKNKKLFFGVLIVGILMLTMVNASYYRIFFASPTTLTIKAGQEIVNGRDHIILEGEAGRTVTRDYEIINHADYPVGVKMEWIELRNENNVSYTPDGNISFIIPAKYDFNTSYDFDIAINTTAGEVAGIMRFWKDD